MESEYDYEAVMHNLISKDILIQKLKIEITELRSKLDNEEKQHRLNLTKLIKSEKKVDNLKKKIKKLLKSYNELEVLRNFRHEVIKDYMSKGRFSELLRWIKSKPSC